MKARRNSPYTSHTPFPCAHLSQLITAHHSRHRHAYRARPARAQTCVCDRCMWQVCERAQYQSGCWGLLLGSWAHRASHSSGSGDEVHGMHHMAGARVGPFRGLQASLAAYNAVQGSGLGMSTAGCGAATHPGGGLSSRLEQPWSPQRAAVVPSTQVAGRVQQLNLPRQAESACQLTTGLAGNCNAAGRKELLTPPPPC
jgi:hypothetical protein